MKNNFEMNWSSKKKLLSSKKALKQHLKPKECCLQYLGNLWQKVHFCYWAGDNIVKKKRFFFWTWSAKNLYLGIEWLLVNLETKKKLFVKCFFFRHQIRRAAHLFTKNKFDIVKHFETCVMHSRNYTRFFVKVIYVVKMCFLCIMKTNRLQK